MPQADPNVVLPAWGEPELVDDALSSVREHLPDAPIYVLDGRLAGLGNPPNVTPGLLHVCQQHGAQYERPPAHYLPFGYDDEDPDLYYAEFAKAQWVYYEAVPAREWALAMRPNERLRRYDIELDDLHRRTKYAVQVTRPEENSTPEQARLFVPEYWTFILHDVAAPRHAVRRGKTYEQLREVWAPSLSWAHTNREYTERVVLEKRKARHAEWFLDAEKKRAAALE